MESPLAIWATDIHITETNHETVRSILNQLLHKALDLDCEIWLGGDIFTSRKSQTLHNLLLFKSFLDDCYENAIIVRMIPGNHDKVDYKSKQSWLDLFSRYDDGIILHDSVVSFELGKINVWFCPYFDEKVYADHWQDKFASGKAVSGKSFLFTHIAVNGVKNNDGTQVSNGIQKKFFDSFKRVFVGHYHNRQKVGNIVYTGSTHPSNFGEDNEKGIMIFYPDGSYEFEELKFKKYVTHTLDSPTDKEYTNLLDKVGSDKSGNVTRVVIKDDSLRDHRSKKRSFERIGVKVEVKKKDDIILPDSSLEITEEITEKEVMEEFEDWAKEKNPVNLPFGREKLIKIMNERIWHVPFRETNTDVYIFYVDDEIIQYSVFVDGVQVVFSESERYRQNGKWVYFGDFKLKLDAIQGMIKNYTDVDTR